MKSLSLLAIVTFALSFTAAAPLESSELSTNALVQRDTDTADTFPPPLAFTWIDKREVENKA
ncbi:hypothetical protein M422DRAFT_274893 [Sphaerobolus stellatus SS14]|uniref:Uncharacterized protein n=1 Tax=Sphaerobolus stellatus (strain SS14) TaxID=990650 RepID=A0A0C9UFW5_SPHS4|nr:hypothetical protein M422DRAFT_274893 [Sphaerobolus stellatus SS14]